MNIGKACAIFMQIDSDKYTSAEKAEAMASVLDMPTHNGINKDAIIKTTRYILAERDAYRKAFALACRILDDSIDLCPENCFDTDWPECQGEAEQCGDRNIWECWQKYLLERAEAEMVCRVCGCTQYNACQDRYGACHWIEEDLCSACAAPEDGGRLVAAPTEGTEGG